jgi:hypothetical protein
MKFGNMPDVLQGFLFIWLICVFILGIKLLFIGSKIVNPRQHKSKIEVTCRSIAGNMCKSNDNGAINKTATRKFTKAKAKYAPTK